MWSLDARKTDWPELASLTPERVLDEYDGPRLFTLRSRDGHLFLAYKCAEDQDAERYLVVPTHEALIGQLESNAVTLRDALIGHGSVWLLDRHLDGTTCVLGAVDPANLPVSALPRAGVRLAPSRDVLLRLKVIGESITPHHVPASVVRRAIDGATGAVRSLVRHALRTQSVAGRPAESVRGYYDLPAIGFSLGSFQVEFGAPEFGGHPPLDSKMTIETVQDLLAKGLEWSTNPKPNELPRTAEWSAIIEALAQLAPPQKGPIDRVEMSGKLVGEPQFMVSLTRDASERIGNARKHLSLTRRARAHEGLVREFDKDRLTFILRSGTGANIRTVSFTEDQYGDVWLAFDADRPVTIVADDQPGTQLADLVSITFSGEDDQQDMKGEATEASGTSEN
jgi:hypothetical protein